MSEIDFLISENDFLIIIFLYQKLISDITEPFSNVRKSFSDIRKSALKSYLASHILSMNESAKAYGKVLPCMHLSSSDTYIYDLMHI